MENYENKELLKEAAKQSLESLKDLKPGTDEYTNTAKMACSCTTCSSRATSRRATRT